MGEILRNWIQARLGVMMDLTPGVFGHYTRDGTLLAQMLHSYDIITRDQLNTIVFTQDPALCRVNLKHLRFWLRFLGIDCDDENIAEISCGKGTASLRLFYKLYLCLETKDRLHFITLHKEREKFVPTSKKFEVTPVSEDPPSYEPPEHPLCAKLARGRETVEWHRSNFPSLLRELQRKREKLEAWKPYSIVEPVEHRVDKPTKTVDRRAEETEELNRFALKHRVRGRNRTRSAEEEERSEDEADRFEKELQRSAEDPEMARAYLDWLKNRRKGAAIATALKSKMQKALLAELWQRMAEKQESTFDEAIARRTLDQSRYEKQIVTKLCEAREQKNVMAENQKMVEDITLKAYEVEHRANRELEKELAYGKQKDIEIECERMCELRRRLLEEKIRKIREKHGKICRRVVQDLVCVALKIAEYRAANDGRVPLTLLSEWKALFLKGQPILDEEPGIEEVEEVEVDEEEQEPERADSCSETKLEKIEVLRDALFDDYLETNPPWNEFSPMLGEEARETFELGLWVLGYLVHRLLNELYPRPPDPAQTLRAKFTSAAIVLGVANPTVQKTIGALLDKSGIRPIRMEDAINYCLERYKEEMSDAEYIDLNVIEVTNEIVSQLRSKKRISCARSSLSNKRSIRTNDVSSSATGAVSSSLETTLKGGGDKLSKKSAEEKEAKTREKETQTPRNIPFDDLDPVLTDSAYIGKWVYEFLALGEPIGNELATKVLIEYLKSPTDAKGWALIDYPNEYEQMSMLEAALTGSAPPPDPKRLDFEDVNIEEVEPLTPRIVFEDQSDPLASNRRSRLVPDPIANRNGGVSSSTFATLFVRVAQKPKNFQAEGRPYEPLPEDASSIDKFYASRKIAYALYYSSLDASALKRLARLVIGEPLQRKPSEELFGDALTSLGPVTEQGRGSKAPVVRRLLPEAEILDADLDEELADEGGGGGGGEEHAERQDSTHDYFQMEFPFESRPAKPGEPNWRWIDLPLPSGLLASLANLWEGLERVYVEDLKELLLLKSVHAACILPYKDFVTRNMSEFVKRPDEKQNLLHEFHRFYNDVDPDARHDLDVKCELHRRVADLQANLWEICDARRREAEEERRRFIEDHWTVFEAIILYNVYVGLVQAELDRFVDTMRLIQDYYMGMMKKSLREIGVSKVLLNRMEVNGGEAVKFEERQEQTDRPSPSVEEKPTARKREQQQRSKGKGGGSAKTVPAVPPAALDVTVLRREIDDALIDRQKSLREAEECCAYHGILENVRYARSVVDAVSATANELIGKEPRTLAKEFPAESGDSIAAKVVDLASEWQYAVAYEIDRVRSKLDSIVAVARLDVMFLLETVQGTFHRVYDSIVDRYWRETKSVNEMANVFCFAIEEGRPLEKEMLLDGDRFVIRSNVFVMPVALQEPRTAKEADSPSRFRIADLARLAEIFKRVAPYGTLSERAFVYILQDLTSHGLDEGEPTILPCRWYQLRGSDVPRLVRYLFEVVDYVDWREFVVHAMDLPMPSHRDLLIARDRFRIQDPDLKETVTYAQYHRTPLWFLDCAEIDAKIRDHLLDDFQRNHEQLYEEELYRLYREDLEPVLAEQATRSSVFDARACCSDATEALRRMLAKELLFRMYAIDRHTVNYTALLLAFCKHEDPCEGFGMALALALGNRLCTEMEEGERYVQELLERKRRRVSRDDEAVAVTKEILDRVLDRVTALDFEGERAEEASSSSAAQIREWIVRDRDRADSTSSEIEREAISISDSSTMADLRSKDREVVVYWLPLDVCLTVLAAALPWHVLRPELTSSCGTLRDDLTSVYAELRDERLNDQKYVALAHRLLNHRFVKRLLHGIGKFTAKNMGDAIRRILQQRQSDKTA